MAKTLSRRELLRGASGITLALPLLDAMVRSTRAARLGSQSPVRLVWLHTESGMWMPKYKPTNVGNDFDLTYILEPLAPFRSELSVLSGLRHANAFKRNPQTGRHVQDGMCHLTGADLSGTPGVAVRNTVSIDQVAAESLGGATRLASLNLTVDRGGTLSYSSAGTPLPAEWDPRVLFTQLFGGNDATSLQRAKARFERNQSALDLVMESTRDLQRRLGPRDRHKVDDYLSHLREVEKRAAKSRAWLDVPAAAPPENVVPPGSPPEKDRTAYVRVMLDMLVLALQADQTRLATARIGFMGCQYPDIGCPDGYHGYTHHDNLPERQEAMAKVDRHRMSHLAYFLEKLRSIKEGEGTLLDNCLIHYGAGMGQDHESTDLANLLVGRAGGQVTPRGHVSLGEVPLANLYVRMMHLAGLPVEKFGDSTEPLGCI